MNSDSLSFWERAQLRAAKLALRARPAPIPDWDARPYRVLFLRHDKIGDMIMSTGVLRAIAESHSTITLDVLASPTNASVLDGLPFLGEVITFADRTAVGALPRDAVRCAWALRSRQYDAVVDGIVLTPEMSHTTAMLLAGCGARRRIGMGGADRYGLGVYTQLVTPPADAGVNHVEHLARLAAPFGVDPADVPHPTLCLSTSETAAAELAWQDATSCQHNAGSGTRLLINVSAGHARRRWGDAQFVDAIRHARATAGDVTVLVIGDPAERASVVAVAEAAGAAAPATASVRAALALVATATVVLTPDTAIAHAASAFRKSCVTLMLRGCEEFIPYRTPGWVVFSPEGEMTALPLQDVTRALDECLTPGTVHADAATGYISQPASTHRTA